MTSAITITRCCREASRFNLYFQVALRKAYFSCPRKTVPLFITTDQQLTTDFFPIKDLSPCASLEVPVDD